MFRNKCFLLIILLIFFSCKDKEKEKVSDKDIYEWKTISVTASAYNSLAYQTDSSPSIAAFGDSLKPGMKCIAVSRDLLKLGIKHNTPVKIEGFDSIYLVKDKMNARWEKRIDIYMGTDIKAARNWGKKQVSITYGIPKKK